MRFISLLALSLAVMVGVSVAHGADDVVGLRGQLADERANERIVALQREMTRVQRALEDLNHLPAPRPLQFRSPQPRLARA